MWCDSDALNWMYSCHEELVSWDNWKSLYYQYEFYQYTQTLYYTNTHNIKHIQLKRTHTHTYIFMVIILYWIEWNRRMSALNNIIHGLIIKQIQTKKWNQPEMESTHTKYRTKIKTNLTNFDLSYGLRVRERTHPRKHEQNKIWAC